METTAERPYINIEDEMRRSYLDYAMSVIIGRALPDARDGFKPVHRRVLWAMQELGNQYNKPYKKSARVVGDCFVKGTLVHTERGLKPIEEIEVGERVQMPDGYTSEVVAAFHNPPSKVVSIRLSNGNRMTVTPGQLFRVLKDDLSIGWEQAENLEGKRVLVSNPRVLGVPETHDSDERRTAAYIAGLLVAEGFLTDRSKSKRVGVQMVDREPLNAVIEHCEAHGVKSYPYTKSPQKAHHQTQFGVRFTGLEEAYDVCFDRCATKHVPAWVLADRRLFPAFIAGFTDGDGHIRTHEAKREVLLASTSELLSTQLQTMLADFGIHAHLNREDIAARMIGDEIFLPRFTLCLTGENASRFCTLVADDIRIARKKETALRFATWTRPTLNTETECLPSRAIFDELAEHHLGGGWFADKQGRKFRAGIKYVGGAKIRYSSDLRDKDLSYRQIEAWGIHAKLERLNSPLAARLKHLMEIYCLMRVASVEEAGEAETFDVQIADDSHEFLVQGCAVHNCIGKYHPHGDTAVYDTIVRMAQDFSMRYPLVDGQGNFGSVDGDSPAAMRYTEVRMSRLTNEMLGDIEKETVDFQPNYDESLSEPKVLPARVPQLLINGSDGIAVGMATKIPPHNLTEVVDATIALIRKPHIGIEELIKIIPGPDFPTAGFIYGREGITQAYLTGRGIIQMRARAGIDRIGRGSSERDAIIITEIPYQLNKARLIERIAELINEKKLDGISDLRDESNRVGMRIVVELKRDAVPQVVLNKLYKMTPMQSSFGVINLSIVNGQPRVLNLKQMLEVFVEFRREVVRRRTEFELRKAKARAHILEGLNRAIDGLDYIIPAIRNASSVDQARQWLTGNFDGMSADTKLKGLPAGESAADFINRLQRGIGRLEFSELQAQAILDLQLRRLSALERQRILDEYELIIKLIAELEEILASETSLRRVIVKELEDVKKEFGDKRRTEIVDEGIDLSIEDLIADEDVAITVTNSGYIKRTPITAYARQGRGGKGKFGAGTGKNNDFVEHLFIASTHAYIMIFTDDGQVFKLKVHELPDADRASRGKAVVNLVNIPSTRKLAGVVAVRDFTDDRYIVMVTRKGVIKKTALSDFKNINIRGINAINIDEGDELLDVIMTDGTKQILIATHDGIAIKFNEEGARAMGRAARGTRGITLRDGDYVVAVSAVTADGTQRMLSVSEMGYGKQTKIADYRLQSRGGRGVINMKTNAKTGKVVAVFPVEDDSELMIITQQAKMIRIEASEIRKTGRSASGVRLIKTGEDDRVTSASLLEAATIEDEAVLNTSVAE
ncbi:MAG: DNA gyrase subunit A [Pyrinomonadaceae bacterium MAG19_C2-C3]|nr:DNA gyrase subunit A [Pyrinomonadaceae bacterium MAG19_C2-C3]